MKRISGSWLLILISLAPSCELVEDLADDIIKCSECDDSSEKPLETTLNLQLDMNYYMDTEITVYEGKLEDNIVFKTLQTAQPVTTLIVPINKQYTITATYYMPPDYYMVVDSAYPKVKYTENQCEEACWYVYDRNVDLRLKYKD